MLKDFLADALGNRASENLDFEVETTALLIIGFTERATDAQQTERHLIQQANFLADLLIARFELA